MKDGLHKYSYKIDQSIFEENHNFNVKDLSANVELNLYKTNRLFDLTINLEGKALVECDRCLDDFYMSLANKYHIIIKLDKSEIQGDDSDIVFLPEDTSEINVKTYIYEAIVFSIPMRRVHPDDSDGNSTCNAQMISKLNEYLVNDKNIDPRWEELKRLLN